VRCAARGAAPKPPPARRAFLRGCTRASRRCAVRQDATAATSCCRGRVAHNRQRAAHTPLLPSASRRTLCAADAPRAPGAGELAHEKAKAKEIIVQLKREVEVVLQESESAAAEAREDGAAALAEAERELAAQRANVEWLSRALERAEERNRGYEGRLAAADAEHAPERLNAALAKARAPLELRAEGLAVRTPCHHACARPNACLCSAKPRLRRACDVPQFVVRACRRRCVL
jgi:hypothetical protein